jgi:hypothetical protein
MKVEVLGGIREGERRDAAFGEERNGRAAG